jgi:hypothetical protein
MKKDQTNFQDWSGLPMVRRLFGWLGCNVCLGHHRPTQQRGAQSCAQGMKGQGPPHVAQLGESFRLGEHASQDVNQSEQARDEQ